MKFRNLPEIKSERLTLGNFSEGDCDYMVKMLTDAEIKKTYMIPDFPDRAAARSHFDRMAQLSQAADRFVRAICVDGKAVGGRGGEMLKRMQDYVLDEFLQATNKD